jgi:hypothetical protein
MLRASHQLLYIAARMKNRKILDIYLPYFYLFFAFSCNYTFQYSMELFLKLLVHIFYVKFCSCDLCWMVFIWKGHVTLFSNVWTITSSSSYGLLVPGRWNNFTSCFVPFLSLYSFRHARTVQSTQKPTIQPARVRSGPTDQVNGQSETSRKPSNEPVRAKENSPTSKL